MCLGMNISCKSTAHTITRASAGNCMRMLVAAAVAVVIVFVAAVAGCERKSSSSSAIVAKVAGAAFAA